MSDRAARLLLLLITVALAGAVWRTRLPQFWGDGATYHSMAWSLAEDGDLEYRAQDIYRVRREFPSGPQGLFLKRASGGLALDGGFPFVKRVPEDKPRLYFAKSLAYPVVAAPFVRFFGTRGLLLTNVLFFGLGLWLGYGELRRQASPLRALAATVAVFGGTVAPAYLFWPAPEIFNFGLIVAGLVAWRRGWPLLSALLLGVAVYSKPYNLWLAIPLGVAPLLGRFGLEDGKLIAREPWRSRVRECLRRGAALALTVIALFGVNAAVTGEANYQGGRERKTFYKWFPFEFDSESVPPREVTFGNSGIWMSTETLGPRVAGEPGGAAEQGAEPARAASEFRQSFLWNLAYFWIGRFGGLIPYFLPLVLGVVLFLLLGPRQRAGWLALLSLIVSEIFYLRMIPDNWYGGSGTLGNRYALNLLPLIVLLVPKGREWLLAGGGLLGAVLFTGALVGSPVEHALHPGRHAMGGLFRQFPAELTMLNDLAVFAEPARKKQPVGDTEGDSHKHWPADPKAYYLYFPDQGTYLKETLGDSTGFWLRGGQQAEVMVRALEPVRRLTATVTGGPAGDEVGLRLARSSGRVGVAAGATKSLVLDPGAPLVYKDSFVYVLKLRSERGGDAPSPDGRSQRHLGAFVSIALEVSRRR